MLTYKLFTNPFYGMYTIKAGERSVTVRAAEVLTTPELPADADLRAKVRQNFTVQAAQAEYKLLALALEDVLGRLAKAGKAAQTFGVSVRVCVELVTRQLEGADV